MDETQIAKALSKHALTAPLYRGTFAADEIEKEEFRSGIFILNTAPRRSTGEHWVLCFIEEKIIYFDSFGVMPLFQGFWKFVGNKTFFFNSKSLQSVDSLKCGEYCLYFAAKLSAGFTLPEIRKKFTSNTHLNELLLPSLLAKEFPDLGATTREGLGCCNIWGNKDSY